jgi:DNA-binding response OmpR family regulator
MVQTEEPTRFTVLLPVEQEGWHHTVMRTTAIHAAVLDVQMPQLGGMQVVKLMQEHAGAPPAILLAERLSDHLLREALGMQVFSVLAKPVELNVLLDALARVLRRYHEDRWPE